MRVGARHALPYSPCAIHRRIMIGEAGYWYRENVKGGDHQAAKLFRIQLMSSGHNRSGLRVPHDRRSIRLPGYDYARLGVYFVTICTHDRQRLLGEIIARKSHLNPIGYEVQRCWLEIPQHFPHAKLDAFVIMPDHLHGIIGIIDVGPDPDMVGGRHALPLHEPHALPPPIQHPWTLPIPHPEPGRTCPTFGHPPPHALSAIVGSFKSAAARAVNVRRGRPGQPIWQRNYYEHIIRNEPDLHKIRRYIETNPARWDR